MSSRHKLYTPQKIFLKKVFPILLGNSFNFKKIFSKNDFKKEIYIVKGKNRWKG